MPRPAGKPPPVCRFFEADEPNYPTMKVVIGESDPEGCAARPGPARRTPKFEDQPWLTGYRQLASNDIDLPVLNVFRQFAKLGEDRREVVDPKQLPLEQMMANGAQGAPDIGAIATRTADGKVALLLWRYRDDDVAGPDAQVRLALNGRRGTPISSRRGEGTARMATPPPPGRLWGRRNPPIRINMRRRNTPRQCVRSASPYQPRRLWARRRRRTCACGDRGAYVVSDGKRGGCATTVARIVELVPHFRNVTVVLTIGSGARLLSGQARSRCLSIMIV